MRRQLSSPARLALISTCLLENMGSKSVKGLDRTTVLNVERTAVPTYCEVYLAASHDVVQEGIHSVKLQNEEWRVSLRNLPHLSAWLTGNRHLQDYPQMFSLSCKHYISNTHMQCTCDIKLSKKHSLGNIQNIWYSKKHRIYFGIT